MNYIDCHSHSNCSFDAENTVAQMFEEANKQGLVVYAVTDHFEADIDDERNNDQRIIDSCLQVDNCKALDKTTKIIKGVEIGHPLHDLSRVERLMAKCDFDYILASVHAPTGGLDFYYVDFKNLSWNDMDKILEQYFTDIYNIAVWSGFDILSHLTYPYRYIKHSGREDLMIDLSHYGDIIRESFKTIIQNGKGIEINTSGLFQAIGETMPNEKYIKLYRELGGEILSVGSDSHSVEQLGRGLNQAARIAKNAGFKYYTYFEKRKPIMISID